ncbi:MAG: signal peptidase II [Alphaproteobacteria bacterium]|nr:signal peptidase II [Alphaproteobacteria bacterium]
MLQRKFHMGLAIAFGVFVIDRISKWWIMDIVNLPKTHIVPLLPFLNLRWAENRGISFSLLTAQGDGGRWLLVGVTAGVVVGLAIWLRTVQNRLLAVALGLVIVGALGNIYDRAVMGYVADFVQFYLGNWSFAIFNVADSCITLGAALLIWDAFFGPKSGKKPSEVN